MSLFLLKHKQNYFQIDTRLKTSPFSNFVVADIRKNNFRQKRLGIQYQTLKLQKVDSHQEVVSNELWIQYYTLYHIVKLMNDLYTNIYPR